LKGRGAGGAFRAIAGDYLRRRNNPHDSGPNCNYNLFKGVFRMMVKPDGGGIAGGAT
jgi:hypothetical protein